MQKYKNVLIVQPYGIGDLLFLTPVFRALKKAGVENIDLLLGSRTEAVVVSNPSIHKIYSIDKDVWHREGKVRAFLDLSELSKKLRSARYDLLLDYSLRGEYGFMAQFFWGISKRAGFDYKRRGFFHNIKIRIPEGFEKKHVTDFFCELAEKAGVAVPVRSMEYFTAPADEAEADRLLNSSGTGRFAAVTVGGGESWGKDAHFKRWPARSFAELAESLKNKYGLEGVVILGSKGEKALADEFKKLFSGRSLNLCGQVPLGVSAALIKKSALFLGNDGGLMHLAHALQTPVIALYGPVDPGVYGPYPASRSALAVVKKDLACRPCYARFRYNSSCEHRECLQNLSPREVLNEVEQKEFRV